MGDEILYRVSQWPIFGALLIVLLLAVELGYRMGRRARKRLDENAVTQITAIEAGVLGLLALLLAFTFAMAVGRYETRRDLVVREANAIGTAVLRSQLLPEPARGEVRALFREYVDARLSLFEAEYDVNRVQSALISTERLQLSLWSHAADAMRHGEQSLGAMLFLTSLNDVIDLHAERVAAQANHVPEIVLRLEVLAAVFAVGLVGYGSGAGGERNPVSTTALAILIAAVGLLIVDLDRPRRGLIRVSQQPMLDLQKSLEAGSPAIGDVVLPR